jgi:uncharacterized protein (TIGR02453 family)
MGAHFSAAAVKFLRGLQRNNEREWFQARKEVYEEELKGPMLAVIGAVNAGLAEFAPEHVRAPEKCMMRIYRDIRFSPDKRPYKQQVAAWWGRAGLEKTSGGGFYFHVSATEVRIAAGVFMPEREQLLAIRRHLLEHHKEFRATLKGIEEGRLKSVPEAPMRAIEGARLARAPKGFPVDHAALDLIVQREWGVGASLPVEAALGDGLVEELVARFRLAAPLVSLLNAPLRAKAKEPLF